MVKQKYLGDCVIACLAMLLNKPYMWVAGRVPTGAEHDGVYNDVTKAIAAEAGHILKEKGRLDFDFTRPAIIVCDSLNQLDEIHAVYWDGAQVFDPSRRKTYTSFPSKVYYALQEDEEK